MAPYLLGCIYDKGKPCDYLGNAIAMDQEKAILFFEEARKLKNSDAVYRLAEKYDDGVGILISIDLYKESLALGSLRDPLKFFN